MTDAAEKRKFRLNAKNLFLTWPKNDLDSGVIMNKLTDLFGMDNINYVCVSEEEHADGSPHLHALVCLKKPCDIRDVKKLDEAGGKHGNYQSTRNVKDVFNYVRKNGKFVEYGTPPAICKGKITDLVAQHLREGGSLDSAEEMAPAFVMLNLPKLQTYCTFLATKRLKTMPRRCPLLINNWGKTFEIGFPRKFKEKQYWIYGEPNTGKTTFIEDLKQHGFRGYQIPKNGYYNDWTDDAFDFAYIDEFKGQISITFLNEWLQGSEMKLPGRYMDNTKKQNIPTFILSNFDVINCYKNVTFSEVEPLILRLHIIRTT